MTNLSYSDVIQIPTFDSRFKMLMRNARIGDMTFNGSRFLNQEFYRSKQWRDLRDAVIVRDNSCDLAHQDYQISERSLIRIHHINPLSVDDFRNGNLDSLLDMRNLITVSFATHNALHYGKKSPYYEVKERRPYDTCPWR